MNSLSGDLTFVDAFGWIALVNGQNYIGRAGSFTASVRTKTGE